MRTCSVGPTLGLMEAKCVFKGVGVALISLFNADGSLNASATADLAATLVDLGVTAVVAAGTTGEAAALDSGERVDLLQALRKVLPEGSQVPLIAGTGARSTAQAVEYTMAAQDAGADAVLTFSLPETTDQRPHYEAVAAAAQGLPVLAYNIPRVSSPGIALELLDELPVAGLKDSSGDAGRVVQTLANWDRPLYLGSSNLIAMGSVLGCAGMILGLANAEPEDCIAAFDGDARAQLRLAKPIRATEGRFPAGLKELVAARFGTSTAARLH